MFLGLFEKYIVFKDVCLFKEYIFIVSSSKEYIFIQTSPMYAMQGYTSHQFYSES